MSVMIVDKKNIEEKLATKLQQVEELQYQLDVKTKEKFDVDKVVSSLHKDFIRIEKVFHHVKQEITLKVTLSPILLTLS